MLARSSSLLCEPGWPGTSIVFWQYTGLVPGYYLQYLGPGGTLHVHPGEEFEQEASGGAGGDEHGPPGAGEALGVRARADDGHHEDQRRDRVAGERAQQRPEEAQPPAVGDRGGGRAAGEADRVGDEPGARHQRRRDRQRLHHPAAGARPDRADAFGPQELAVFTQLADELGYARDVEEGRRRLVDSEKARWSAERQYLLTVNMLPIGVAQLAPDGTLVLANDGLCRLLAVPREELLGLKLTDF